MFRLLFSLMFLFSCGVLYSQTYSFEIITDPKCVAMGESFVANTNGIGSIQNNPATLIGVEELNFYYNYRSINWTDALEDMSYFSFGSALKTSFGILGLSYHRNNYGEILLTTPETPNGNGLVKSYEHTFAITFSNMITDELAYGINVKKTAYILDVIRGAINPGNTHFPLTVDFGFIYKMNGFYSEDYITDKINFGLSFQNINKDLYDEFWGEQPRDNERILSSFPFYMRLGTAYFLDFNNDFPFQYTFTFEYKRALNDYRNKDERDFWGAGMEATFYNLLSLRFGGIVNPYTSIYGDKGIISARYGLGINLPLKRLGLDSPLTLSLNYAVIPLKDFRGIFYFEQTRHSLDAFNIQLNYPNPFY